MPTTAAKTPPEKKSPEAKPDQLDMARKQGEAYAETLDYMAKKEADAGGQVRAGEYVIAYAVETAEGLWYPQDGSLEWQLPTDENAHIEISVRDAADNRFIPMLDITLTVLDSSGKEIGTHKMPFLWHPWLYHYGRNWHVPGDGEYTFRVHVAPPNFPRHDEKNGQRYTKPVDVEFNKVQITTGQKQY